MCEVAGFEAVVARHVRLHFGSEAAVAPVHMKVICAQIVLRILLDDEAEVFGVAFDRSRSRL